MRELDEIGCRVEAEELLKHGVSSSIVKEGSLDDAARLVVAKVFNERDADSLKHLALALIAHPNVVALLGSRDREAARLVFARSPEAAGDMNALMRKACEVIDGRGGGKPDMAQGGGRNVEKILEAIDAAITMLSSGSGSV